MTAPLEPADGPADGLRGSSGPKATRLAVPVGADAREQYVDLVRIEIQHHRRYYTRQMRWYRTLRLAVLIAGASVPVAATVAGIPRWVLGGLGAIVAIAEGAQQLMKFRDSALIAMKTGNDLEHELRTYLVAVAPYAGSATQAFPDLVKQVERIRRGAENRFAGTWRHETDEPAHEQRQR